MSLCHYQKLDDEQDSIVFCDDCIKNHSNFLLTSNKSKCSNICEPTEPTCINNNKNYIIGASCSFVSALLSCLESEIAKFAFKQNENLNSNDYVILSTPVILILIFISVYLLKIDLTNINREGMKWITVRSIASILGISALYSAIKYLPTSKVLFIKNLHPLLVTACGYCLLNECINKFDIVSLVGAFIGTVVMNITKTNSQTSDSTSYETFIGIILSIIATFCTCGIILSVRMTNLNIHYLVGVTYYKCIFFTFFLLMFIIFPSLFNSSQYSFTDVLCFNISGIFNFCALILQAASYHYCEMSKITVMNYFSGIFAFIIDLLVFKYAFSTTDIVGILITVLFLFAPALYQIKMIMIK